MPQMLVNLVRKPYQIPQSTKLVGQFHDYLINKGIMGSVNHGMGTVDINTCVGGILKNDKRQFIFHLAPEIQPLQSLEKSIRKQIETLRETCDDVHGLICGGLELNNASKESVDSFNLYNTVADILDKYNVKFSMLCGKTKNAPHDNLYAVHKTVNLWNDMYKNLPKDNNLDENKILDMLEEQYQFVEKHPEHQFSVLG